MSALRKEMKTIRQSLVELFDDGKWFTTKEIMETLNVSYSVASNGVAKLIASGYLKKARYGKKRITFYAKADAPDLVPIILSEELKKEFERRTSVAPKSLAKVSLRKRPLTKKKPMELKKVVPSVKEPEVETLLGASSNAIAAINAIGSLAEDHALMVAFIKQIHEESGKILKQIS
jgi:DNA-binding transcriptional regulator GbsR (MarR family)